MVFFSKNSWKSFYFLNFEEFVRVNSRKITFRLYVTFGGTFKTSRLGRNRFCSCLKYEDIVKILNKEIFKIYATSGGCICLAYIYRQSNYFCLTDWYVLVRRCEWSLLRLSLLWFDLCPEPVDHLRTSAVMLRTSAVCLLPTVSYQTSAAARPPFP